MFDGLPEIICALVGFVVGASMVWFLQPKERGFWCSTGKHYITPQKPCRDCAHEMVEEYKRRRSEIEDTYKNR